MSVDTAREGAPDRAGISATAAMSKSLPFTMVDADVRSGGDRLAPAIDGVGIPRVISWRAGT
jgi:hypothetical protein